MTLDTMRSVQKHPLVSMPLILKSDAPDTNVSSSSYCRTYLIHVNPRSESATMSDSEVRQSITVVTFTSQATWPSRSSLMHCADSSMQPASTECALSLTINAAGS